MAVMIGACTAAKHDQRSLAGEYERNSRNALQSWLGFLRKEHVSRILFVPKIIYASKSDPFFQAGPPQLAGGKLGALEGEDLSALLHLLEKPAEMSIWETGGTTEVISVFVDRVGPPPVTVECSFLEKKVLFRFRDPTSHSLLADCIYGSSMTDFLKSFCTEVKAVHQGR